MNEGDEPAVHGMRGEAAEADWPVIEHDELRAVLARVVEPATRLRDGPLWHSPRPFSAATMALLEDGRSVVVKRHHRSVRTVQALEEEHDFAAALREGGMPVPEVLGDGCRTALDLGSYVYEVWEAGDGADHYRDAFSWTPYRSEHDAEAAGRTLARLHLTSSRYRAPARRPLPLLGAMDVISSAEPLGAVERLAVSLGGLSDYLSRRSWRSDLEGALLPLHERALPHLSGLKPLFTHNDWHPSNLLWAPADGSVAAIFDFGLSNQTTACYDLATAIERSCIDWLDPRPERGVEAGQVRALLTGYCSVRPLRVEEAEALAFVLPIVHVEYALSEVDYFHGIVHSSQNATLAYEGYLLGHLAWFASPEGAALCSFVGEVLADARMRGR